MEEKVTLSYSDDVLIASLFGEIDHHSAVDVRKEIDSALYAHVPKTLVLDVGGVDFMDSSGLGLIMGRYTKAKEIGTALVVRNPSVRSEKMLKMAGMDRIVRIESGHVETTVSQYQRKDALPE